MCVQKNLEPFSFLFRTWPGYTLHTEEGFFHAGGKRRALKVKRVLDERPAFTCSMRATHLMGRALLLIPLVRLEGPASEPVVARPKAAQTC